MIINTKKKQVESTELSKLAFTNSENIHIIMEKTPREVRDYPVGYMLLASTMSLDKIPVLYTGDEVEDLVSIQDIDLPDDVADNLIKEISSTLGEEWKFGLANRKLAGISFEEITSARRKRLFKETNGFIDGVSAGVFLTANEIRDRNIALLSAVFRLLDDIKQGREQEIFEIIYTDLDCIAVNIVKLVVKGSDSEKTPVGTTRSIAYEVLARDNYSKDTFLLNTVLDSDTYEIMLHDKGHSESAIAFGSSIVYFDETMGKKMEVSWLSTLKLECISFPRGVDYSNSFKAKYI